MNDTPVPAHRVERNLRFARTAAVLVMSLGGLVMAGWVFDIPLFKSVLPGLVIVKFNTALVFFFSGAALLTLRTYPL